LGPHRLPTCVHNRFTGGSVRFSGAVVVLATAFAWASVVMTITSAAGIARPLLVARHRPPEPLPVDYAAAAAATSRTLPTPTPEDREAATAR
jgi:hypothetical protein